MVYLRIVNFNQNTINMSDAIIPDVEIPLEKYTPGVAITYYTSFSNQLKEAIRLADNL